MGAMHRRAPDCHLRHLRRLCLTALFGVAAGGCGDGLAGADFRGDALFTFSGQVASVEQLGAGERDARVSVFWAQDISSTTVGLEQASTAVEVSFPSTFQVHIFHPPEAEHFITGEPYAIGRLLMYDDVDHSSAWSTGDELLGGAENKVLLYASEDVPGGASPTGGPIPQGYALATVPMQCAPTGFEDGDWSTGEDCGANLGLPCSDDSVCGTAECLTSLGLSTFEGGYCALSEQAAGACWPDGALIELAEYETVFGAWFFKNCASDSDCRVDEGYACDPLMRACFPVEPTYLNVGESWFMFPLCFDDDFWADGETIWIDE